MNLSREYTLKELKAIGEVLGEWIKEIDCPMTIDDDGAESPVFDGGQVPPGLSVSQLGLPVSQIRSELAGLAGRLEALISAG